MAIEPLKPVVPHSEALVGNMFDRIAKRYDFLNHLLSLSQDKKWRKELIEAVPFRPDGALLDVATGTGDLLFAAGRSRREYKHFAGVDISEGMLALAKEKLTKESSTLQNKTTFTTMSAEVLKFPDQTFDCVTISFGLRNVIDKERALAEFFRVLKPNGYLLILEFFPPQTGMMSRVFIF
jgi:demethylmenaquinone methyltransferase/2-methoxy-6-polyprenyl-1,4-benzoquinol methylase